MTVLDARQVRKAYPGRRLGTVYCYRTWRPDARGAPTGVVEVGYVGQTVQALAARDSQHRGISRGPYGEAPQCQPWSDLVVGDVTVVEQGRWRYDELLERELFHIRRLRPRYNHAGNLAHGGRLPVPEARRQRQYRDRARGAPVTTWPAPARRPTWPAPGRPPTWRPPARRRAVVRRVVRRTPRRVVRHAGLAGAVLVLWLLVAVKLGPPAHVPWRIWPIVALAIAVSPVVWVPRRRDNRRLAAVALAVATVGLVALT